MHAQVSGRGEGKLLGIPVRSAIRGIEEIALHDSPGMRAVPRSVDGLRGLLDEVITLPAGVQAMPPRSRETRTPAAGRGVPRGIGEG